MPRVTKKEIVVTYGNSGYHVYDLGENKNPRFELICEKDNKTVLKTNDPKDCHNWIKKNIWNDYYEKLEAKKEAEDIANKKKRKRKTNKGE